MAVYGYRGQTNVGWRLRPRATRQYLGVYRASGFRMIFLSRLGRGSTLASLTKGD